MNNPNFIYHLLMLVSVVLVASSFPVGEAITNDLPPTIMMLLRFLLAAALFAPYVFIRHGLRHFPSRQALFHYTVVSAPLVIFFWCMFEALRYTTAINTGALFTLVPAMTAIFAFFINREITGKLRTLGLILGTAAALMIVFREEGALANFETNHGDLIFFIGCLFMGLYNALVKKFYRGEPMEVMTFWVLLAGAGWLLIASWNDLMHVNWIEIENQTFVGILYLSFFTTLITFFLLQLCVVKIGATNAVAYNFLTPVFVLIISIMMGNQEFEYAFLPGMLLVFIAMIIIQRKPNKAAQSLTS